MKKLKITVRTLVPFERVERTSLQIVMALQKDIPAGGHLWRHTNSDDAQR